MKNIENLLDSIILEGNFAIKSKDGDLYNFMPSANKVMNKLLLQYKNQCLAPIIERIKDPSVDGPALRVFLYALLKLIPTKQSMYEQKLSMMLPKWEQILIDDNEDLYSEQFCFASTEIMNDIVEYPKGLIEGLEKCINSKYSDVVSATLKVCQEIGTKDTLSICFQIVNAENKNTRLSAINTCSRLAIISEKHQNYFYELILDSSKSHEDRISALEILGSSSYRKDLNFVGDILNSLKESEICKNPLFLDKIFDVLDAQSNIRSLEKIIDNLGINNIEENTLRKICRNKEVNSSLKSSALTKIFKNDEINKKSRKYGLIAHRNSSVAAAFVGHAGIFINDNTLVHCTTGKEPHAVRKISYSSWKDGLECWGIREDDDHNVNLNSVVNRALEICSWRTEYDGAHNNQKGKWFKGWFCSKKYWESDCVGFTEHCYEFAGGNPTPRSYEYGTGWPLTVREQRDNMRKILDC